MSENLLDSRAAQSNSITNKNQARLRLAWVNSDLIDDPLRYDQSKSGRTDSHGTAPPLSRSSATVVSSAIGSFVDKALRRYPTVVPLRRAKDSCSSRFKELRYVRSGSSDMGKELPMGNDLSIPMGYLPGGNDEYASGMGKKEIMALRRVRLAELVSACGGQADFAEAVSKAVLKHKTLPDSLKSFENASYVNRALQGPLRTEGGKTVGIKGGKNIGEGTAAALEIIFGKEEKWMSQRESLKSPWPFKTVSKGTWEQLRPDEKADADRQLRIFINGLISDRGEVS